MKNWLKDHCRWYRRLLGGRWAQWNGFWEQELTHSAGIPPYLYYRRGYRGRDLMEGIEVWDCKQTLNWDDKYISAREDYTKSLAQEAA